MRRPAGVEDVGVGPVGYEGADGCDEGGEGEKRAGGGELLGRHVVVSGPLVRVDGIVMEGKSSVHK